MPIQETELTSQIKKLEALKAETQKLEQSIQNRRPSELAGLPEAYGFSSLNEFVKAVKASYGKGGKRKVAAAKPAKKGRVAKVKEVKEKKARTRARITDEVKAKVKQLVEEGKSGSQIAKALGISLPSVQNIKKAFGLVKSKVAAPAVVAAAPAPEAPAAS
jgi:transposase